MDLNRRRLTPWVAAAVIAVCAVVAAVAAGWQGLVGALVGGLVVVVFFGSTPAVLGPVVKTSPRLSLVFALVFFLTKVVALVALFVVLATAAGQDGPIDARSLAATVIVTTLAWLVARVVDATRDRTPMYDLPADDPAGPDRFKAR